MPRFVRGSLPAYFVFRLQNPARGWDQLRSKSRRTTNIVNGNKIAFTRSRLLLAPCDVNGRSCLVSGSRGRGRKVQPAALVVVVQRRLGVGPHRGRRGRQCRRPRRRHPAQAQAWRLCHRLIAGFSSRAVLSVVSAWHQVWSTESDVLPMNKPTTQISISISSARVRTRPNLLITSVEWCTLGPWLPRPSAAACSTGIERCTTHPFQMVEQGSPALWAGVRGRGVVPGALDLWSQSVRAPVSHCYCL